MTSLAADLIVAGLLVLTSTWCAVLYRQLQRLRVDRSDVEAFLSAVDGAACRAELAIAGLRDGAADAQRRLALDQQALDQRMAELARLIENAGRMARRVESALHQGARAMAEEAVQRERPRDPPHRPPAEPRPAAPEHRGPNASTRSPRPRLEAELARLLERLR
ncbi:MAG: hypothetical protein AB7I59_23910 [Geminicoccaceae bacterium]